MPSESENIIGTVVLHRAAKLIFSIKPWKGQPLAHVRKFVSTARYDGPTRSGLTMAGDLLVSVIETLRRLQAEAPGIEKQEYARVSKRGEVDVVVSTIPPDDLKALPSVDVREYMDTPDYTGPTKKGIRFSWEKLPEVIAILETQAKRIGKEDTKEQTLFPSVKPKWLEKMEASNLNKPEEQDKIIRELLPEGPKMFPKDFLDGKDKDGVPVKIPVEPVEIFQQADGKYFLRSDFGFSHPVRNKPEGKYLLYASLRGERAVHLPQEMIVVFRTVAAYENYLRELRHSLVQAYERKTGHRPMAEHQAQSVFRNFGLPWIET